MTDEPESLILQMLRQMRAEMGDIRENMATKADLKEEIAGVRSEIKSLAADVASDILDIRHDMTTMRKETSDQIAGLRRAVMEYHTPSSATA